MIKDSDGNLWFAQPGNQLAYMIDSNLQLHEYKIPLGSEGVINLVREGRDGVYIASTGKTSYLYFKARADTAFRNISIPVRFQTHGDFNITDLTFLGGKLWLASSEGLLKMSNHSIERADWEVYLLVCL